MNDALCVQCRLSRLDSKAAAQQQPLRRAFCQALELYFSCRATNGSLCGEPRWQRAVSLLNEWLLVRFSPDGDPDLLQQPVRRGKAPLIGYADGPARAVFPLAAAELSPPKWRPGSCCTGA